MAYTEEEYFKKCKLKHNNKYDYIAGSFSGSSNTIDIICQKHGRFKQKAVEHMRGKGCKECGKLLGNKPLSKDEFVSRAIKKHGNKYNYSLVDYINIKTKVKIICKNHGTFMQTPSNHLNGFNCKKCSKEESIKKRRLTREQAIEKINKNSSTKWEFDLFEYKTAHDYVTVICPKHGKHTVICNSLFNGYGCPSCATHGFNVSKPAILYYLKIVTKKEILYKLGITNRTVEERFNVDELKKIEIINILNFNSGLACLRTEQALLNMFKEYKREGEDILKTGNTELFIKNILPGLNNG